MKKRNSVLAASAKETDRQLQEELKLGDKRDDDKVRNLTLMLAREQADIERNEAAIKRADDSIKASKEIIVQEKVDAAMGEEARKQERANEKLRKEIKGIEGRQANIATGMGYSADVSGINETITGKAWESMLAAVQKTMGSDVTAEQLAGGQVKLSAEAVNEILRTNSKFARDNLSNMQDQAIMFKTGLALQKESAANQLKIDERKAKLAETDASLAATRKEKERIIRLESSHTGSILETSGIIAAQKGQVIIDDILVAGMMKSAQVISGLNLMNLQRESLAGQAVGSSAVTVVNNSSQQINQSRPMILPPSPIMAGNGGSTLAAA